MTPPNADETDVSFDRTRSERTAFERRPLLKAVGAGATFSFGSGIAAAAADESDDATDEESDGGEDADSQAIDPVFGYPTTEAGDIPADLQPDHEVQLAAAPPAEEGGMGFLYFEPIGIQVGAGDIVQFTSLTPDHTVTAMHPDIGPGPRVPEGSSPFSSPIIGPGMAWLYQFEQEGVYDVYCGPHFLFGMVMRLVVGDVAEEDLPEYARSVEGLPSREQIEAELVAEGAEEGSCEWPTVLPAEVLDTDALDPIAIAEAGSVPFETVAQELGYDFQPPGEGGAGGGEESAASDLATRIEDDGRWVVYPDDPALWRRSETPIDLQEGDGRWLAEPTDDGTVRCRVENDGGEGLANAGCYFDVGPIGDVERIAVESTSVQSAGETAQLLAAVYLDVSGDGDYFEWESADDDAEQFVGLGSDEEGIAFPLQAGRSVTIDDETGMLHFPSETEVTFGAIKAGEVGEIEPDTPAAFQISVMGAGEGTAEEAVVESVTVERA